ncbi:MAG: hypothetical protein ACK4MT_03225 [Thermaurantiacus tibetensis]|uniref:hypothetical protein n=1 Tax=Thermaurantiacus tibetensis TaxID=2759035 RepID=UPI001F34C83D|nr:hypothetical protein [Thermaurantiacus tibetensis]
MTELVAGAFTSGRAVDLVLAVLALEALLLLAFAGRRRADLLLALLPGLFLLLAVRAALAGAGWQVVAACLAAALPAHLADLWRRLRRAAAEGSGRRPA